MQNKNVDIWCLKKNWNFAVLMAIDRLTGFKSMLTNERASVITCAIFATASYFHLWGLIVGIEFTSPLCPVIVTGLASEMQLYVHNSSWIPLITLSNPIQLFGS